MKPEFLDKDSEKHFWNSANGVRDVARPWVMLMVGIFPRAWVRWACRRLPKNWVAE